MLILVRVDDRLLHGQIICSWVPFTGADALVVASDEAASDSLVSEIISACGCDGLKVYVKTVAEAASFITSAAGASEKVILVVGELRDAIRLYQGGVSFSSLNLGNIHHEENGRKITSSIIVNPEDEDIIDALRGLGVNIEIRAVPKNEPVPYPARA